MQWLKTNADVKHGNLRLLFPNQTSINRPRRIHTQLWLRSWTLNFKVFFGAVNLHHGYTIEKSEYTHIHQVRQSNDKRLLW